MNLKGAWKSNIRLLITWKTIHIPVYLYPAQYRKLIRPDSAAYGQVFGYGCDFKPIVVTSESNGSLTEQNMTEV